MVRVKLDVLKATFALLLLGVTANAVAGAALSAEDYAQKGLASAEHFPGLASLCDISELPRDMFRLDGEGKKRLHRDGKKSRSNREGKNRRHIAPQQVFDNLYYVGAGNVASWAIDTGESIVLVDALNSDEQAEKYIVNGLAALGLSNKPVSHLIISHGHGDHYGGFELIKSRYSPRIVMSEVEFNVLEKDRFASFRWGNKPQRNMVVNDGDVLTINGTQLSMYVTPGHTPGTLTLVFPVTDGDEQHRAVLWGGTGLNYGPDVPRIKAYTNSASQMQTRVLTQNIDVFLSNHPGRAGTRQKLDNLSNRSEGAPHPFVQGKDVVLKAFSLLENCTRAQWMHIEETRSQ